MRKRPDFSIFNHMNSKNNKLIVMLQSDEENKEGELHVVEARNSANRLEVLAI